MGKHTERWCRANSARTLSKYSNVLKPWVVMALPVPNGPGKTLRTNPGPCPVTACSARNRDWIQSATIPAKNEETGGPYCSVVTIDPWLRQ